MSARPIPSKDDDPPPGWSGGGLIACLTILLAGGTAASAACQVPSDVDRYRAVRELSVGEMDGPLALTRVEHIVVHGPRVFVSQPSEQRIRVLSAESGELLDEWGRAGDGPGEMRRLGWMGLFGDTVVVLDDGRRRIIRFTENGSVIEASRLAYPPLSTRVLWMPRAVSVEGNALAARTMLTEAGRVEAHPDAEPWFLLRPDGMVLDSLPPLRPADRSIVLTREGGRTSIRRPFHRGDRWAVATDGSRFVLAGDHNGDGLFLLVYDTRERRTDTFDLGAPSVPVDPQTAASIMGPLRDAILGRGFADGVDRREREAALAAPEWVPAVDEMFVTADGETWLREPNFIGSASDLWRVVDPEGAVRATVEVPSGVVLRARDGNHVWGYRIDPEFRFYTVERLRIEPIG